MNLIKDSFFKEYPIEVINNGVDTSIFKHTESNIKERYGIKNKKVILGVASVWDKKKGLDTFIELSKQLDNEYQIVLIGLNKKQIKKLPSNIIGITRTENVEELVKWYSAAEVFFNPTLEDNYPTVNLEAIACETPVVTFNTGGSPESGYYGKCILNNNKLIFKEIKNINTLNDLVKKNISLKYMNKYYLLLYEVN